MRAFALTQKELLLAGESGVSVRTEGGRGAALTSHWGFWQGFAEGLDRIGPDGHFSGELAQEPELCTNGLIGLIDELTELAQDADEIVN